MEHTIIDRRGNPSGRSLPNRQKFLKRARDSVRKSVADELAKRRIDATGGANIPLPTDGIDEPTFHHNRRTGRTEHVVPGNKEFIEGDTIPRPDGGGGGGGREGSPDGKGEDAFLFTLTEDELWGIILDGLELPRLVKRSIAQTVELERHRAGYSVSGTPSNLALKATMRKSIGRRIALHRPTEDELEALKAELEEARSRSDDAEIERLEEKVAQMEAHMLRVAFIDPIDVRYRRFDRTPKPIVKAVMFCLMDVSGSMTEAMKFLAKQIFMLIYVFLTKNYQHVDIVFVRHTSTAEEVDHDTFFYSRETGGTVVSSVLEKMLEIVRARYSPDDVNIFGVQVSDGDNYGADSGKCVSVLGGDVLPICQDYVYLEVGDGNASARGTDLWRAYEPLTLTNVNFAMRHINELSNIADFVQFLRDLYPKGGVRA